MKTVLSLLLLAIVFGCVWGKDPNKGQHWAVLVAGSKGYYNYRHQSDVCHAYQILKKNGIPDSNIIVMMYDDIAYSSQNPKPGSIINEPNGPNVYPGVPKDYVKGDVTPQNFLDILSGKDMSGIGSGKTVKSGPNDKIFIYWTDHGAPGLVAFPSGVLHAKDWINTLQSMHSQNKYKEMVIYLEACESGSMFNGLLRPEWNIYATTAANPHQSSYACYYDSTYRAYLDDCYSIYWMNDTEYANVNTRTLQQQYVRVKQRTTQSEVCQYGNVGLASEVLAEFQSNSPINEQFMDSHHRSASNAGNPSPISSRDVYEDYLKKNLAASSNKNSYLRWKSELRRFEEGAKKTDIVFGAFAHKLNIKTQNAPSNSCNSAPIKLDCVKKAYEAHINHCGPFSEYSLRYANYISKGCEQGISADKMAEQFQNICSVVYGI